MIFFHESLSSGLLVLSALLFSVTSLASLLLNLGPYYYEDKNAKKYLSSAVYFFAKSIILQEDLQRFDLP
jgi:hypothetical protein